MQGPWVNLEAVGVSRRVNRQRLECRRRPHIVERTCRMEARSMPLWGASMCCEVTSVSPLSLRMPEKQPLDVWTEDSASTITVETSAGATVEVPVFCTTTSNSTSGGGGTDGDKHPARFFVDISSVCSQDNVLLRDMESGELLVPQPQTLRYQVAGVGEGSGRHAARKRRKRIVVMDESRGRRYQLVAVTLKKKCVERS
ncbi:hypothetical protein DQ04_02751050 [Trypanosoma grayi]|uniref:hypothetical protein n=1 Tax=Trypanosoma grayi TaxID=71804 RepID=UPI0004F42F96|nr:hypothetical protein DQ04_02751050 [Trypanosoma grayi]KEG11307.1 hypothetical protein DQ04_02751050 [Trypanosoma grayi]